MTLIHVGKAKRGNHSLGVGCQSLEEPCAKRL